jgi:hypothetical protein
MDESADGSEPSLRLGECSVDRRTDCHVDADAHRRDAELGGDCGGLLVCLGSIQIPDRHRPPGCSHRLRAGQPDA